MQKTAYEMRISDWSSDVCSSDLANGLYGASGKPLPRGWRQFRDRPRAWRGGTYHRQCGFFRLDDGPDLGGLSRRQQGKHRALRRQSRLPHQNRRESGRDTMCPTVSTSVVAVSRKKKKKTL